MANRMTTYGYGYIDGKLSVIESEAEIVRRVFKEYCNGAILSEIGQSLTREGVEYYMGCTQWNKNRIKRIIENEKYIGADGYPQIVDEDEFVYANKLKDNRGRPQAIRHSSEVETARDIVYCGQCGRIMGRRSKWRSREKWLCPNGCKQDIYIADTEIFGGLQYVFNKVNAHPKLLNGEGTGDCYNQTMDVLRINNDIHRLSFIFCIPEQRRSQRCHVKTTPGHGLTINQFYCRHKNRAVSKYPVETTEQSFLRQCRKIRNWVEKSVHPCICFKQEAVVYGFRYNYLINQYGFHIAKN